MYGIDICICRVASVRVLQMQEVGICEIRHQFILEGGVHCRALVVHTTHLLVLSEDALILLRRRPWWDGYHSSWVGWVDEGGCREAGIPFAWEDNIKVAVLASTKGTLTQLHVHCQELVSLLDGGIVVFSQILWEGGGWKPLENGIDRYGGLHAFRSDCWVDQDLLNRKQKEVICRPKLVLEQ